VSIKPLIYGSGKSNELKPGTPALPLIAGFSKALRLSQADLEKKEKYISLLNDRLCKKFSSLPDVQINKTKYSIPHILNVSLLNIKPETFIHAMDSEGIYLSTNTACSSGELSSGVMAIFNDVKRSTHTIRISLSSQTTSEEITRFLEAFDKNYHMLNSLVVKD